MRASACLRALAGLGVLAMVMVVLLSWNRSEAEGQAAKADESKPSADEVAIRKVLEAYVTAFNEHDVKKLVATLSETAEFIDDANERVAGAEAIGSLLNDFFKDNSQAKLQVTLAGVRMVAPAVAIEDGESVVTNPETMTQSVRKLTMVFARTDQGWKIASIREYPEDVEVLSPEERLKELEWLVGEWLDEGGDTLVTSSIRYSADRSHLIREFSVIHDGAETLRGLQWIGIDPLTGNIKSWSFDNAGGAE